MAAAVRFAHLHVHSEYSLLDGANRIKLEKHHESEALKNPKAAVKSLLGQVRALGMSAAALTDHGNVCGAIEFYREARRQGVKAVLGMEAYVAAGSMASREAEKDKSSSHLTILAGNHAGWRNLIRLSSLAHERGFYYKPRIDRDLLARHADGLVVLSGCLKAEIPQFILKGKAAEARKLAGWYKDLLGPDRFFLELMDHGLEEQKTVVRGLVELGKDLGLKTVATNDAHFLERTDALAQEVLICIHSGKNLDDPKRLRFSSNEFYLKSPEEMLKAFAELPDAVARSWEIADRCTVELVFADDPGGKLNFPPFKLPPGYATPEDYLRHLCLEGVKTRYGAARGDVLERLDVELKVIGMKGFATYFLIVGDIVRHSKAHGILVGPGRGSAAGSLVAYVLGITDLDPLKYGLIFERFLNPERTEPPDIDIDFPDNRRDEVVSYIRSTYGEDNVAQIVTFARMNARAVVRDVGRVLGFPYGEMDRLAKLIPGGPNSSLAAGLEQADFRNAIGQREEFGRLLDVSRALESLARHASKHAAGVVIAPPAEEGREGGLREHAPLIHLDEDSVATQFDMDGIKHLGLLKIDILGLKTLTVLDETRSLVKATRGVDLAYLTIPVDDAGTYRLFAEGRTDGIFQFESSGMRDAMRKLKPDRLEDLIALNALYRPGPMEQIDTYIRRRRGQEPAVYDVPELEPILKDTYGVVVYQEQVIQIAHHLGGYSMGQADSFRSAMGKKNKDVIDKALKAFVDGDPAKKIPGAVAQGIPRDKAVRIAEFMEKFAGYGFNRSHSAAYALIAYWTAWLKTHYPAEFMAALLTSESGNHDKTSEYVGECRRLKLHVLPPDVNRSRSVFTVEREGGEPLTNGGGNGHGAAGLAVRFGLAAVKNVGESATELIVRARESGGPFTSLAQFCERVDMASANRKVLESLVKVGAFDGMGGTREQLVKILPQMMDRGTRRQKEKTSDQVSLFGATAVDEDIALPPVDETQARHRLSDEKELLGCYVSGHPLADYEAEIAQLSSQSLKAEKLEAANGAYLLKIAGVVSRIRTGVVKKSKETFARFMLEDLDGSVEAIAWPEVFKKAGAALANGAIVMVTGTLQREAEGRPTLIVKDLMPLGDAQVRLTKAVHLHLATAGLDEGVLKSLQNVVALSPGDAALILHLKTLHHGEAVLEAAQDLKVRPTRELLTQLRALVGDENVKLADRGVSMG